MILTTLRFFIKSENSEAKRAFQGPGKNQTEKAYMSTGNGG